jgi:Tol biopolymer transport system component
MKRKLLNYFLIVILLSVALMTTPVNAQPKDTIFYQDVCWSPDGTKLLMSRLESNGDDYIYKIFSVNADGSDYKQVTSGPRDIWVSWLPDGKSFVLASKNENNTDIYIFGFNGNSLLRLTTDSANDTHPDLSADGRHVAFISNRSGHVQIHKINVDGSRVIRLTNDSITKDNPRWSPDDKWIAYFGRAESGSDSIYIIGSEGNNKRTLCEGVWPSWSPDGSKILYTLEKEIYQINIDGTDKIKILDSAYFARWSPDGKKIAFNRTTWRAAEGWPSTSAVFVANSDGTEQKRVTPE